MMPVDEDGDGHLRAIELIAHRLSPLPPPSPSPHRRSASADRSSTDNKDGRASSYHRPFPPPSGGGRGDGGGGGGSGEGDNNNVTNCCWIHPRDADRIDVVNGDAALIVLVRRSTGVNVECDEHNEDEHDDKEEHSDDDGGGNHDGKQSKSLSQHLPLRAALCYIRVSSPQPPLPSGAVVGGGSGGGSGKKRGKRATTSVRSPMPIKEGEARLKWSDPRLEDLWFDGDDASDDGDDAHSTTTTTTTTSTNMKTPSPSKSKFSFARGGGGGALLVPSSSTSTPPPGPLVNLSIDGGNKRDRRRKSRIAVAPLRNLTDDPGLRAALIPDARYVTLRPLPPSSCVSRTSTAGSRMDARNNTTSGNTIDDATVRSSSYVLERLILAYHSGSYVMAPTTTTTMTNATTMAGEDEKNDESRGNNGGNGDTTMLSVSFRGRSVSFEVVSAAAETRRIGKNEHNDGRRQASRAVMDLSASLSGLSLTGVGKRNNNTKCASLQNEKDDENGDAGALSPDGEHGDGRRLLLDLVKRNGGKPFAYRIGNHTRVIFEGGGDESGYSSQQEGKGDAACEDDVGEDGDDDDDDPRTKRRRRRIQHVAGLDTTLRRILDVLLPPLLRPDLFPRSGPIRPPRGVLVHGPSGVGKTELSYDVSIEARKAWRRAATTERQRRRKEKEEKGEEVEGSSSAPSGLAVHRVRGSDVLASATVAGEAERKLARLFAHAERRSIEDGVATLLIFDDVHLICPRRGAAGGGTSGGGDRISGTLLALLDGIGGGSMRKPLGGEGDRKAPRGGVAILAITSNPSLLDPALRRPGRIDTEVEVPVPDDAARAEILRFHLDRLESAIRPVGATEADFMSLGRAAKGFTGADCYLAVKEAVRAVVVTSMSRRGAGIGGSDDDKSDEIRLTIDDLRFAIRRTKPSAIQSVAVEVPRVPWSSIGGMHDAKRLLRESIEMPLDHADLFAALQIPPPRGVLLYGPPGCSKTLMARALATEGHMNFLAVKGPEMLSKWLGESERALASLFRRARLASPCVIFFDEIDAIASKRGSGEGSGGGERLLSQLLTELDGINTPGSGGQEKHRVVVVGATNRPDILDSALTRPGRIDRMIYVGLPDWESRECIFGIGLKGKACDDDINITTLASDKLTNGYSGAEIIAICRDAALYAIEEEDETISSSGAPKIGMRHLLRSIHNTKRRITPDMLQFYASFRNKATL